MFMGSAIYLLCLFNIQDGFRAPFLQTQPNLHEIQPSRDLYSSRSNPAGAPSRPLTRTPLGVRRLLALVAQGGAYSLAERDAQLRAGSLDVRQALPIWQSEVIGFVERTWGDSHRRFAQVVMVGGGAQLLREALLRRFRDRAFIPDDPIIATARGLYKYLLSLGRRRE